MVLINVAIKFGDEYLCFGIYFSKTFFQNFLKRSSLHEGRAGDLFHRKRNAIVTMASVLLPCCLACSYAVGMLG